MTDLELLAYAATAAGYNVEPYTWSSGTGFEHHGFRYDSEAECQSEYEWNPLEDDGDALRLAAKLRIEVYYFLAEVQVKHDDCAPVFELFSKHADPYAATRRAIVRAAAELGNK